MDAEAIARQLVRALRGRRSQLALSRRLGFGSNVVYTWECGRRAPSASAFFRLAALCKVDLPSALRGFLSDRLGAGSAVGDVTKPSGVAALLGALAADRTQLELAALCGADRTTVARWLSGATEPKLPELLRLVDGTTQRVLDFVSLFADPSQLASAREAHHDLISQRRLAYEMPWSHAVLRALELSTYAQLPEHQPGFVAAHVGLPPQDELGYLDALEAAGQIKREAGRYVPTRILAVDTRPSEAQNRRLKTHWADVARERLAQATAPASAMFSYNLFAIGPDEFERIRRLHIEYYERVREIIAACQAPDRVVLINQQLVPLAAPDSE